MFSTSSCCTLLGLTASRSSSAMARGLLRSPTIQAGRSSCCIYVMICLCALCSDSSLCSSPRSSRILDNLESFRSSRFPHLHGCGRCVGRELRLVLHAPLVAPAMVPRHRLLQWRPYRWHFVTITLCSWSRFPRRRTVFRLIAAALATPVAVPMYISWFQTSARDTLH